MTGTFMITRRSRLRDGNTDTQTHREEDREPMEADMGVTLLYAKGCQRLPVTTKSCKRPGTIRPRALRGSLAPPTPPFLTSSLQNYKRIDFCCFKLCRLWYFVIKPGKMNRACVYLYMYIWHGKSRLTVIHMKNNIYNI